MEVKEALQKRRSVRKFTGEPVPVAVRPGDSLMIAGAGPINSPIQAAVFGWVPVLLWILIGGVFFGAVQDFVSMYR